MLKNMTEPQLRDLMNGLAKNVADQTPDGTLFFLVLFDDPGLCQYVSNARREDIVKAMRETADRLEGNQDVPR